MHMHHMHYIHPMHDGRTSPAGMRGMAALSQARSSILPTVLPIATTTGANRASTVGTCSAPEESVRRERECRESIHVAYLVGSGIVDLFWPPLPQRYTSSGDLNVRVTNIDLKVCYLKS